MYTAAPNAIQSTITLSTFKNILILHPDILITATSIANSAQCARRPLIGALLSSTSDVTPSLVWGNMLHEIIQACLADGRWDRTYIDNKTTEIIHVGMESLIRLDINIDTAKAEIRKRAKGLEAFSRRFIGDAPKVS
jgi:DNA replication ATP-dependent helicase Dna2